MSTQSTAALILFASSEAMDLAFIALILGLFALSWGFVRFCAALLPAEPSQKEKK